MIELIIIVLIAIGLSMDAFAVSISAGIAIKKIKNFQSILIASFFGFFQFIMPVIGWLLGQSIQKYISAFDHWIAFILLAYIGGKMAKESLDKNCEEKKKEDFLKIKNLTILAIATSIDALAVGISFALLNTSIITASLVIGIITFAICFFGVYIGNKAGCILGKRAELLGGIILIGIGLKILIEHLIII